MNAKKQPLRFVGIAVLLLLLFSLWMMYQATSNPERFGRYYYPMLVTNSGALLVLLGLIAVKLFELWKDWKQRAQGILMTLRLVSYATLLVLAPVLTVYYFSQDFLRRGIDSWFNLQVEEALEDALALSKEALNVHTRTRLRETEEMIPELIPKEGVPLSLQMDETREQLGATELTMYNRGTGEIIASSSADLTDLVPRLIDEETLSQLSGGNSVVGLIPFPNEDLRIHVAVNVAAATIDSDRHVAQALFTVPPRINELTNSVQTAFGQYKNISYLREQLKITFILILTLVLLFAVFSGIWGVFALSDKLLAPIGELVRGTQQVAIGDYNFELAVTERDELGFLVQSFNIMTARVAASRHDLEEQRSYLNVILERISSGVMVFDQHYQLRTWNNSSQKHLLIELTNKHEGQSLDQIGVNAEQRRTLDELDQRIKRNKDSWQEQIHAHGEYSNRILRCSGTTVGSLPGDTGPGHIVVIDDVTELVHSQRSAAWREVAQRLAHEIRNPLTPIQLAAERLRRKCLPQMQHQEDISVLTSLTTTIENQVQAMRSMLDAFRQFASPPRPDYSRIDLLQLIRETVNLYLNSDPPPKIELELGSVPPVWADRGKMLQVLNNLLSNALHADQGNGKGGSLTVSVNLLEQDNKQFAELQIRDSGSGMPPELMRTMFEPYVTGRETGTGLGLAIVKKIVDEHGGFVRITNNDPPPGACATVLLPVNPEYESTQALASNENNEQNTDS